MSDTTLDFGIVLPSDFLAHNSYRKDYSKDSCLEHDDCGNQQAREQELWRAVILQAVFDAKSAPITSQARREKTQAIMWLSTANKDFQLVCELAGMDPKYVMNGAKKSIKQSVVIMRRKLHLKKFRMAANAKKKANDNKAAEGLSLSWRELCKK